MDRVVLIFIDGLGVGGGDPETNPLVRAGGPVLRRFSGEEDSRLPFGGVVRPLDACLGVEGLPQSATGQTALFTGINAPARLGYHRCGFPNRALREIILEHSLLKRVREGGGKAAFLNAYRPRFFELGEAVWETVPLSVTTWVNRAAGLPFFDLEDLAAGRALYQEFTNRVLRERGFDVPERTPGEAGRILAARSVEFHLLLFEYFRTDAAGHGRDMARACAEVERLEAFLGAFLRAVDLDRTLVVITSDHGNLEDLSVRGHTRNPVMTLLFGAGAPAVAARLRAVTDVTPVLLSRLGVPCPAGAERKEGDP